MLPSNTTLSKNIQYLLNRYRRQKQIKQPPQQSIFAQPSFKHRQRQNNKMTPATSEEDILLEKQKMIKERIRLIHNYSFKKLKSIQKKKRKKSMQSLAKQQVGRVNRYNMSVDSTIQLPHESNKHSRSRDESIQSMIEERSLRRRGTTQYIINKQQQKVEFQSIDHKTIEMREHCILDYQHENIEKKIYETKKKQWMASKTPIFTKASPREALPCITSNLLNGNTRQKSMKSIGQQSEDIKCPSVLNSQTHQQKENAIIPTITAMHLKQNTAKSGNKKRNSKQMFYKRVLKSKTTSLKLQDDKISPWGLPQSILEQESPMMMQQRSKQYF